MSVAYRKPWNQKFTIRTVSMTLSVALLATASQPLYANVMSSDMPSWHSFFSGGIGSGLGQIIVPFILTLMIEVPLVMVLFRKNLPLSISATIALFTSTLTYPVAFFLYLRFNQLLLPIELLVIGLSFYFFFLASWWQALSIMSWRGQRCSALHIRLPQLTFPLCALGW